MTVPVSESPDERNLRRLVNAINANAETANTNTNTNTNANTHRDGGGGSGGVRSGASNGNAGNSSSRSPTKNVKGPRRNGDPAPPPRRIQRSPPRHAKEQHLSPKTDRSSARTNDDAAAGRARRDLSPSPERRLELCRASWTCGGHSREKGQEKEQEKDRRLPSSRVQDQGQGEEAAGLLLLDSRRKSAAAAATASVTASAAAAEMRGQEGREEEEREGVEKVEERGSRGVIWGSASRRGRAEVKREPADVLASGERGAAATERLARRRDREQGGDAIATRPGRRVEQEEEFEDSLPIEDRLQAVMKDLGVPSGGR